MFREIDTNRAEAVRGEVTAICDSLFPGSDGDFLKSAFGWVEDAFGGRMAGYQAIDTRYHDLKHTLEVTLCFARLLEGYKQSGAQPELPRRSFELAMVAMLLHDTGYLKREGDSIGTGAKYTLVHVDRSSEFAEGLLSARGLPAAEIRAVQNMICCTGVNAETDEIGFQSELERTLGFALATADLVGQIAAADYVERLTFLYAEFEESNRHNEKAAGPGRFASADELRRQTPAFWRDYVMPRINDRFGGLQKYLARPPVSGKNVYLQRVEENLEKLRAF